MRRCNDTYEIVTVYYPTGCVNTTRTTTSTSTTLAPTTTTTSSTSTTSTTTTLDPNIVYRYSGTYHDCETCEAIGGISFYNASLITIDKWYSPITVGNVDYKVLIINYLGTLVGNTSINLLDIDKKDTCGELPPCP